MSPGEYLDDPGRVHELRDIIQRKVALHAWYAEVYERYAACLAKTPSRGLALELGSGGGFAKARLPQLLSSDILPYAGIDAVLDATSMPFANGSLRFIGMLNVFHHVSQPRAFLAEARRCLMSGGRLLIIDQHPGHVSSPILRYAHHEPFRPTSMAWEFESSGPLSGANGALAWIVFQRDREQFGREFPELRMLSYTTHSPLRYWLAGGLKSWSIIGRRSFSIASRVDALLTRIDPDFGSFVDVEIVRA